jgi:hypothetical protein
MRYIVIMIGVVFFATSCSPSTKMAASETPNQQAKGNNKHFSIKLAIPEAFRQQATMQHVSRASGNKMSSAAFTTSKVRRGEHVDLYQGRHFFLENILWNQIGIQKDQRVIEEEKRFRYTLTDGKNVLQVDATEERFAKKLQYQILNTNSIFNKINQLQQSSYVFSAFIYGDTAQGSKNWELMMTNMYDRQTDSSRGLLTAFGREDAGLTTNGKDTIFIKPLSIKQTELDNGKIAQLPIKILAGYELSTPDGVIAIIDLIDRNIWFYNELNDEEKLNISGIATAIFARTVYDANSN